MKKYTILKTFELPDEFKPNSNGCEENCPFAHWVYETDGPDHYDCGIDYDCPFICEGGWSCRVNDVTEDNEFVHFTDKEAVEYKDMLNKAYKSTGINIFDMRDATPEEEKGVTDYIMSIAEPTGIKFDEVE